ncbi:MAG TPA: helix-turn-helix domain-containing protein [Gemmatimonadaceae bacterium]|jgi:AraC-like DNA-binding protein|nr:helix-turn-helix domain-containing protein [Gemmatimonadaceae bacterium]
MRGSVQKEKKGSPVLAQQAGRYREYSVPRLLRDHFSCIWVNRLSESGGGPFVVIPDGTIDLQWVAGKWRVAGPDRLPMTEQFPAGTIVIGFRFQPASASAWLGAAASEFCGKRVWLEDVWGRAGRDADLAAMAHGPDPLIDAIGGILNRWAGSKPMPNATMTAAYRMLAQGAPQHRSVVPWLMSELGLSERTLRRRFEQAFGYGPKTLDRILRFQRYLALGRGLEPLPDALRATAAGYADQSHLVRECRRLALCTPSQLP